VDIIREIHEQLHENKLDNLHDMDKFLFKKTYSRRKTPNKEMSRARCFHW
jgi:hypothetical protein